MRLLIEEYQYNASDVKESLSGLDALENIDHLVSVNYVGYFYNPAIGDCVFILPKVLMNQENLVFGHLKPEDLIDFDNAAGVSSMERNRDEKLPAESSCSKRINEQISIKRQFVSSMVPPK